MLSCNLNMPRSSIASGRSAARLFKSAPRCLPKESTIVEEPKVAKAEAIGNEVSPVDSTEGKKKVRKAESTDPVASFLSRRFGIAGGLAWLGFLAVGSIGEQVKTRMEYAEEQAGVREVTDVKEVVLPSGVRYTDTRIGGGQLPQKGYLAVLHFVAKANGEVFEDTYARGKPIVLRFGGRPFVAGLCLGAEQALTTMKAGGKRTVIVPPELGFGEEGGVVHPTEHAPEKRGIIPGNATLEYEIELLRISIPPS